MQKKNRIYNDIELLRNLNEPSPVCDEAFNIIYNKYKQKIFTFCMYSLSNKSIAEEIFQDTWLKFINIIKNGYTVSNIESYLISIARNLCIDYYRKTNKKNKEKFIYIEDINLDELDNNWIYQPENEELTSIMQLAINHLDEKYKEAIVLNKINGLSFQEISQINGENIDCIKKRVARGIIKLRELMKPYISESKKFKNNY